MGHILVTGANGFIGSHLVRQLLELKKEKKGDEDILCLVRSTSNLSSLKGLDVKLVIGDLRDPESLVQAVKGASYIYHLGAELFSISRKGFWESIVDGTQNLLEAAVTHAKGSLKRFLFVSSQAAAGPANSETEIVTEDREPPAPGSWYAEAKLEAEKVVKKFAAKIPVTVVRPSSVYGERDKGFIQAFKAAEVRLHAVTGFRKSYTGMVYGEDLAEGIIAAANHPKTVNRTYFLTNPRNYSAKEVMKTLAKGVGKPFGITLPVPLFVFRMVAIFFELRYLFTRKEPIPARDKVRDFAKRLWLCSPARAKKEFGWEAKHSLLEGAKATYRFIKEEELKVKKMADEPKNILWLKYFILSMCIGILIEVLAAFGKVYFFKPAWIAIVVVVGLWGLFFGSMAMVTRVRNFALQFIPGFAILFGGELLNHYYLDRWYFTDFTFLGQMAPFWRALVLGIATGFLIPIINGIMRGLYRRKQRLG